jgi:hypothetical protein
MTPTRRHIALIALLIGTTLDGSASGQEVRDGRLTMDVEAGSLADVLQAIANEAGIVVEVEGELGEAEPQLIDDVPLDLAIRRLVGAHSLIMLHDHGTSRRPREVRVYAVEEDPEVRRAESAQRARQAARTERRGEPGRPGDQGDRAARVQTVRELARSDSPEAVRDLGQIVAGDPDPAIRRLAIGALAGLGEREAVDSIAGALNDEDRAVRVQAVRALHNLLSEEVAPYLAQVVETDSETAVRMMAVQLAADLPPEAAAVVLERALADPDEEVRAAAESALGR